MDDLTAVRRAVDRLMAGSCGPLLDLLAEDVAFEVARGGDTPGCSRSSGKWAVAAYFAALGGLPAFWELDYTAKDGRVVASGTEAYTIAGCELHAETEVALVLDLRRGQVTRLQVIEDLAFIPGWDVPGSWQPMAASRPRLTVERRAVARTA